MHYVYTTLRQTSTWTGQAWFRAARIPGQINARQIKRRVIQMSEGSCLPRCSVSQCNASSARALATHGASHSDANAAAIVRATAGPAQICQWTGSAKPRQNRGSGRGGGPPSRNMFKNKQINEKATTDLSLSKPVRKYELKLNSLFQKNEMNKLICREIKQKSKQPPIQIIKVFFFYLNFSYEGQSY